MRRFLFCALVAATVGCHTYSDRTETPWSVHESRASMGLFSTTKSSRITPVASTYTVCLKEHDGNPDAERICRYRDWGFPAYGYAMPYYVKP